MNIEIPQIYFNQGADSRPNTREILQRTKLSKLPSLPKRESHQFSQVKAKNATNCAVCQKSMKSEVEFCQSVGACRSCLKIHAAVDIQLNSAAEKKSLSITRQRFLGKLEAHK